MPLGLPDGVVERYAPKQFLWRVLTPPWSHMPTSGMGSAFHGGRWNRISKPALYLSEPHDSMAVATAWAEYQQTIGSRIGIVVPYAVAIERLVDLTKAETLRLMEIAPRDCACAWRDMASRNEEPPTWRIYGRLMAAGVSAIRVPSAMMPGGINVVVIDMTSEGIAYESDVQVIDPDGSLPVDRTSWPEVRGPV